MAKIINLNKKRKAKKKEDKEKKAAENRIKYGRTKEERKLAEATAKKEERKLDGHQILKAEKNAPAISDHADEPSDESEEDNSVD